MEWVRHTKLSVLECILQRCLSVLIGTAFFGQTQALPSGDDRECNLYRTTPGLKHHEICVCQQHR